MPEAPIAAWNTVAIRYPYATASAVGPVDLEIGRGERVLLLGPSGSGKSTLLLSLTGIVPQSIPAEIDGEIRICGIAAATRAPADWAGCVAHFFQDADQTLCGMRGGEEIAFALENLAVPEAEIFARVADAMRLAGIPESWLERRTMTLSGGEKQLVALAATLVQDADLFVADEPTAHLAPQAASRLHDLLVERHSRRGILIVDHRLDGLIASIDRVVVLGAEGAVIAQGEPAALFRREFGNLEAQGIWCPLASHLDAALARRGVAPASPPLTVEAALADLDTGKAGTADLERARHAVAGFVALRACPAATVDDNAPVLARLVSADCAPFLGPVILKNVDLEIRAGEVLGILGENGAGKSTLAACLAGVLRLKAGRREGRPGGIAFQKPETQFTEATVRDEIISSLTDAKTEAEYKADTILAEWGLSAFARIHPFELSQGQKRRLALASLTASGRWPLIVLDEPLAGLDARWAGKVEADIARLQQDGRALAVITHDMDFALRVCPRSLVVGQGAIMAEGPTLDLLADRDLLTSAGLAEPAIAPAIRWLERLRAC